MNVYEIDEEWFTRWDNLLTYYDLVRETERPVEELDFERIYS